MKIEGSYVFRTARNVSCERDFVVYDVFIVIIIKKVAVILGRATLIKRTTDLRKYRIKLFIVRIMNVIM